MGSDYNVTTFQWEILKDNPTRINTIPNVNAYSFEFSSFAITLKLVEPYVKFTGVLSGDEVAKEMRNSDAVLLFSRKENFPCVIAEAWACGKPVITTDVGGIAEHMDEERGIMVYSGDESALSKAILSLDKDWNAEKIRDYAVKNFSIKAVSEAYTKAYLTALKTSKRYISKLQKETTKYYKIDEREAKILKDLVEGKRWGGNI